MDFKRYVDYRKLVSMEAYHLYIFHNEDFLTKHKQIVMAPIVS